MRPPMSPLLSGLLLLALAALAVGLTPAFGAEKAAAPTVATAPAPTVATAPARDRAEAVRGCLATYGGLPRRPDGRADLPRLLRELEQLGANSYNFLVWQGTHDWDDLKLFLPQARARGLRVWVSLVPPSESKPKTKWNSEPFGTDYVRWAQEIAQLSVAEPALVAWSIDDFAHNLGVYTPAHLRHMLDAAHAINPRLAFVPCVYFKQISPKFAAAYGDLLDGILFPYRNESVKADLTDAGQVATEVATVRRLFRPGFPVIIDVYATAHSKLGASTPEYVAQVLASGRACADGVTVYCHQDPVKQRAKFEAAQKVFRTPPAKN